MHDAHDQVGQGLRYSLTGAVPVLEADTAETLQQRILQVEHLLFPMVLRWAAEGRVSVCEQRASVQLNEGEERFLWRS